MKFSDWLKKNRAKAGLTQKQLSAKLHIPQSMINRYENSDTEPRISFVVDVARVLNCSLNELLEHEIDEKKRTLDYWNKILDPFYQVIYEKDKYIFQQLSFMDKDDPLAKRLTIVLDEDGFRFFQAEVLSSFHHRTDNILRDMAVKRLYFESILATAGKERNIEAPF